MTDRYENIRKALADLDVAAEAHYDLAWRDAHHRFVVHANPKTIRELLAERDQLAAALEAAREDAWRLAFLAREPVIEGFIGVKKDIYDYATDCADEVGRDEFNDEDMLNGLRRLIDAAIDRARGKENGNG